MKITVTEYDALPTDSQGRAIGIAGFERTSKGYTPSGASAPTDACNPGTRFVRISGDVAVHVGRGELATADDPFVAAGAEFYCAVNGGDVLSIIAA